MQVKINETAHEIESITREGAAPKWPRCPPKLTVRAGPWHVVLNLTAEAWETGRTLDPIAIDTGGPTAPGEYPTGAVTFEDGARFDLSWPPDWEGRAPAPVVITRAHTAAPPALESKPDYVFRRTGDVWRIVFEGRELEPVRHLSGLTYLRALLSRPGQETAALDLYRMENPPPPEAVSPARGLDAEDRERYGTGGGRGPVLDEKARRAIEARKRDLEDELQEPDLDRDGRDEREDEIARLDKALASARVASADGGAGFEPREQKQPRQAVAARIETAIDAIADKPGGGSLAKHLRTAVRKGKTLSYAGGLDWET